MQVSAAGTMTDASLSGGELTTYATEGLIKVRYRLPLETLAAARILLDATLDAVPGVRPEAIVCPHIAQFNGVPDTLAGQWRALIAQSEILDMVGSVLGPDIMLWGSQVFCKPPAIGMEVPWHQDGEYWPIWPLATCSVWIALDDVDRDNGAMRYIPGSHRAQQLLPHVVSQDSKLALNRVLDPKAYDPNLERYDELRAGEMSLHDIYLVHGSAANLSARRRAGFVARYMPSTSLFDRELARSDVHAVARTRFAERPIYLVRGHAHANRELVIDLRADRDG